MSESLKNENKFFDEISELLKQARNNQQNILKYEIL